MATYNSTIATPAAWADIAGPDYIDYSSGAPILLVAASEWVPAANFRGITVFPSADNQTWFTMLGNSEYNVPLVLETLDVGGTPFITSDLDVVRQRVLVTVTQGSNNATFNLQGLSPNTDGSYNVAFGSLISSTGTPQSGSIDVSFDFAFIERTIEIDTNQVTDISQMLTWTMNDGTPYAPVVTQVSSGAPASTGSNTSFVITSYDGSEISSGTLNSNEDIETFITTVTNAIDNNTESPIDFSVSGRSTSCLLYTSPSPRDS